VWYNVFEGQGDQGTAGDFSVWQERKDLSPEGVEGFFVWAFHVSKKR
jgi:hypothetical protein